MALATLSIDLVARLASLEEGMSKATRIAEKNAAQIEARYARIGGAVRAVAGVVATAFAGVSIVNLVRSTVDGVDALNDLKDATGSSIENISALEDVAARTGTSFEGFSSTLVKFNKVLSEAKPGSEIADAFKRLGLDVERLRAIDPAEALRQVAVALSGYADDGTKARIVQELFGKSVREAAPFLAELAKQGELVAKVTTQQAEEAEKFNQQLFALQKNSLDSARALTGELVPALNKLFERFREGGAGAIRGGFFNNLFKEAEANIAAERLATVVGQIESLQATIDRQGATGLLTKRMAGLREEATRLSIEAVKANEALKGTLAPTKPSRDGLRAVRDLDNATLPRPALAPGKDKSVQRAAEIDDATRSLAQYVAQLDRERSAVLDLTEEQQALNFLKTLGTKGEIPQVRELVIQLAAELDQRRDLVEMAKLQAKAREEIQRKDEEARRNLNALLEQTPTAQTEALVQLQRQLNEAFERGDVSGRGYAEAVEIIKARLAEIPNTVENAAKKIEEMGKATGRTLEATLGDNVLSALKGNFSDIGRAWGELLQRMVAQALAARLNEALFGNFATTGTPGGLLGGVLGLLGFHTGGVGGEGGEPRRYHTGRSPIGADEVNAVLLKGEEVLPRSDPRHRNNAGAKLAPSVTIVNNVQTGVTRNELVASLEMLSNAMRGEFTQRLRMAGVI